MRAALSVPLAADQLMHGKARDVLHREDASFIQCSMATQFFIDKFLVPKDAVGEFRERTSYNRGFIKKLPGFLEDSIYERTNENGDLVVITVAAWKDEEALNRAKAAVQEHYKQIGFNGPEMMARLKIQADRGIYTRAAD